MSGVELSDAERALAMAQRQKIYLRMHPNTAHGGDRASRQIGDLKTDRFAATAAAMTGQSERSVHRDVARGKALGEDLDRIRGTSLDKGVEMDALVKMEPCANDTTSRQATATMHDIRPRHPIGKDVAKSSRNGNDVLSCRNQAFRTTRLINRPVKPWLDSFI